MGPAISSLVFMPPQVGSVEYIFPRVELTTGRGQKTSAFYIDMEVCVACVVLGKQGVSFCFQRPCIDYNTLFAILRWPCCLLSPAPCSRAHIYICTYAHPRTCTPNQAPVTILFSHGNAEDLQHIYEGMLMLASGARVNVLAYEYTGYLGSTAEPTEEDCYADIEAAYGCVAAFFA